MHQTRRGDDDPQIQGEFGFSSYAASRKSCPEYQLQHPEEMIMTTLKPCEAP